MNKEQKVLFEVIGDYFEYEYLQDIEDYKNELETQIKNDCVSIAESEFGDTTEFSSEVVFVPSKLSIIKRIFSFEHQNGMTEKLYFDGHESLNIYLANVGYDELLAPKIEEETLLEICK